MKYIIIKNPEARISRYYDGNEWIKERDKAARFSDIGKARIVMHWTEVATADIISVTNE